MQKEFDNIKNTPPSFIQRDIIDCSVSKIMDFYFSKDVIKKLTIPIAPMKLIKNEPLGEKSLVIMQIWLGPFPVTWEAQHFNVDRKKGFTDIQIDGPMKYWVHRHEISAINDHQSIIEDKIWYEHFNGLMGIRSKIFFSRPALRTLFKYRSWVTHKALSK
jgi:ligand-binding SRPBCC domain-containing protein